MNDELERLRNENRKLAKINAALMSRVERGMDQPQNAFGLFEVAISLDKTVRRRTVELQAALRSVERTNEALKRAKAQAEQANSFKSTFLAFVSHDLLQPLNAAKLSLSGLMELQEDPDYAPFLRQVDLALGNLEDLIRALLDIYRLDAGVLKPDASLFAIERILEPLRRDFAPVAASRGLKFKVLGSDAYVRSDALMLKRILQNLVSNALRYTRRGGVLVGCRPLGDGLRIDVSDTGPGIADERREAIFEEFQRGSAPGAETIGFGLGLSIVRRFAQALEHRVDLSSRVGHGSTFSICLPREPAPIRIAGREAERAPSLVYGLSGAQVLLIENEPVVAVAMQRLLEGWGCHVAIARSGGEAREGLRAAARGPDLIIADMHLDHGERGLDAIDQIQEDIDIPVPALLVTADHSEAVTKAAAERGLEILRKPVKPAELRSLMAYLLA